MSRLGLIALGSVLVAAPAHAQVDPVESLSQLVTGIVLIIVANVGMLIVLANVASL